MKFDFVSGLILIPIEIQYEGIPIKIEKCVLDTGAATSAINIDLVNINYRKETKIKRLFGIGNGTQEVISQSIDWITIDEQTIKTPEIEFGLFNSKLEINGFIGNDILSRFTIKIKYDTAELFLTH